ncbi:hypothetical protein [Romboutsia sp.]|uniref:hypothetical protein n=1 Tax=Romboutsia sp. TaxID=1965302 RepID=UPI003F40FEC1
MGEHGKVGLGALLGIFLALIVVMGLFIGILTIIDLTGITKDIGGIAGHMWVGFIMVLYITSTDKKDLDYSTYLIKSTPGAILGTLTAYLISYPVINNFGNIPLIVFAIVVILAISCMVTGKLPAIINSCYMLFLTICTATQLTSVNIIDPATNTLIKTTSYHINYCIVIVVACIYFGTLIKIGLNIVEKRTQKNTTN